MNGYRFLPHTADIKVEAWGKDFNEAFASAAKAFTDIVVDISKVLPIHTYTIEVEGYDIEELLYNFIEQLILELDLNQLVFSEYHVTINTSKGGYSVKCVCKGEKIDIRKHRYKTHVKAMTYHEMEIKKDDDRVIIRYVIDI